MHVWLVEWAYRSDAPTVDSVWTVEADAQTRADELGEDDDRHLSVWIRRYAANVPRGHRPAMPDEQGPRY